MIYLFSIFADKLSQKYKSARVADFFMFIGSLFSALGK